MARPLSRLLPAFMGASLLLTAGYVITSIALRAPAARTAPQARSTTGATPEWLLPDGPDLKIDSFYAGAASVVRGENLTICYGTRNAVRVALKPAVHELKPARNRCFSVLPETDTEYRLTAWGAGGESASAAFSVKVLPAPPRFLFVDLSDFKIRRGEQPNVCYGVEETTRVRLEPTLNPAPVCRRCCVMLGPVRTTKYRLRIFGPGGEDHVDFTIEVH